MSEMMNSTFSAVNTIAVIILAIVSSVLVVKYYFEIASTYNQIRNKYIEEEDQRETRAA